MLQLDWELDNYRFDASDCCYQWQDIRLIALRSELEQYPEAHAGDLLVTFRDNLNATRILEHFRTTFDNFRFGSLGTRDGDCHVSILLAPVEKVYAGA